VRAGDGVGVGGSGGQVVFGVALSARQRGTCTADRGLHSFTSQLNVSTFNGIYWMVSVNEIGSD